MAGMNEMNELETVVIYFIVDTVLLFGNLVSEPPNFQTVYLHNRFINFNSICNSMDSMD